jgi:hypothetical protein
VAEEIAKRMGVDVQWTAPSWDVITAGNWDGRWDLSVGSMTINGPVEAAQALGMTRAQTMRRIVLPLAIRVIIPPTGKTQGQDAFWRPCYRALREAPLLYFFFPAFFFFLFRARLLFFWSWGTAGFSCSMVGVDFFSASVGDLSSVSTGLCGRT